MRVMCHCECECDHGNFKTNQNTSEKKLTVQVSFGIFSILTQIQMDTLLTTGRLLLRLVNSERHDKIALRNANFRYRGSIEYRDTRAGIVIVVPISGIAQH